MQSKLEFKNICMEFPGVKALDDMSFTAHGGEVVALLGENGAGKSTLLKILNGDYQHTSGEYFLDGIEKNYQNPHEAIKDGISIIYQERQIAPYLTIAENVFMGKLPHLKTGLIDFKKLNNDTQKVIDEFKLPLKPTQKVLNLSIAHQQMVEIMKAYNRNLRVIAFDEPTASLSDKEIGTLFEIISDLKERGIIILYVSHRLKEIFQISDKVVVFKDGKFVSMKDTKETNDKELVKLMVGRDLGDIFNNLERNEELGEVILEGKNLTNRHLKNVSFELRKGEILGFAGLVGAGRTELVRTIFGADQIQSGEIIFEGKKMQLKSPGDAINAGIALCPEDRKTQGLVLIRTVKENFSLSILKLFTKFSFINFSKEKELCEKGILDFAIKTPSMNQHVLKLSGGNQQKIILARWLASNPKVLILDEPTKGIDVGAKSEIYKLICNIAKRGIGVIVISSELPEVIGLCDRIMIMNHGKVTGEITREEASEEKILGYAMLGMDIGG